MGLPALLANYLFVGPLIVARLQAELVEIPAEHVETADQLMKELRAKALKVMWAGDRFDASEGGRARAGASQVIHQRWLVALLLQNAGQKADARHAVAGPLLSSIHQALAGWTPEGAGRTLQRAAASLAPQFTSTHAVYPLGFEVTLTL